MPGPKLLERLRIVCQGQHLTDKGNTIHEMTRNLTNADLCTREALHKKPEFSVIAVGREMRNRSP